MLKTIFLIVIVAALAGGVYSGYSRWLTRSATTATTTPEQVGDEVAESEVPLSGRGTLAKIQTMGTNLECKIWRDDTGVATTLEGTTFINGSNIRGDYVSRVDGKEIASSMIMTSDHLYVWSVIDGQTYGVEKTLAVNGEATAPALDAREPVPLNAEVRYDCVPWGNVDRTVFTPPSDILFRDLEVIMEGGQEYGTTFEGANEGQDMCLLCERVGGGSSERKACRAQFKCGE